MEIFNSAYIVIAYMVTAKIILISRPGIARDVCFASLNFAAIACVYAWGPYRWALVFYLFIAICHYGILIHSVRRDRILLPALFPILVLFLLKYLPDSVYLYFGATIEGSSGPIFVGMVGISYMAFRLSYLSSEIRNGNFGSLNFLQYSSYAFFLPTLAVGPISRFSVFKESYEAPNKFLGIEGSVIRVVIGAAKFLFLASIFSQFTFDALLLDGGQHHYIELIVACVGFYLYLYFNFSGFCDIAIGMAGILGIKIDENFDNPFIARNVQEFWSRWHITLNNYMRDMLFTPLNKFLAHKFGIKYLNIYIIGSLFLVFLLIGVWHGREIQYLIFGFCHATAVSIINVYGIVLKRTLGVKGYKAYMSNQTIRFLSCVLTFIFISASFLIFANSPEQISIILDRIEF